MICNQCTFHNNDTICADSSGSTPTSDTISSIDCSFDESVALNDGGYHLCNYRN